MLIATLAPRVLAISARAIGHRGAGWLADLRFSALFYCTRYLARMRTTIAPLLAILSLAACTDEPGSRLFFDPANPPSATEGGAWPDAGDESDESESGDDGEEPVEDQAEPLLDVYDGGGYDLPPENPNIPEGCGNNILDPGEFCDTYQLGTLNCGAAGFGRGYLRCAETCDRYDFSNCNAPTGGPNCGDGVQTSDEVCDGDAMTPLATCEWFGFAGGEIGCAETCDDYDVSGCE